MKYRQPYYNFWANGDRRWANNAWTVRYARHRRILKIVSLVCMLAFLLGAGWLASFFFYAKFGQ